MPYTAHVAATVRPKTAENYLKMIRLRVLPVLGHRRVADLRASDAALVAAAVPPHLARDLGASRVRAAELILRASGASLERHDLTLAVAPAPNAGEVIAGRMAPGGGCGRLTRPPRRADFRMSHIPRRMTA